MSDQRKQRSNSFRGRNGEQSQQQPRHGGLQSSNRSKMNHNQDMFQRQESYDRVRKIVQEEGREARNLITWSVPVDDELEKDKPQAANPVPQPRRPNHPHKHDKNHRSRSESGPRMRQPLDHHDSIQKVKSARPKDLGIGIKFESGIVVIDPRLGESSDLSLLNSSQNSSNGGHKKGDLRARYWAFLFENLKRAVDEIYLTCETDESVVECKEVIMMLEQCTNDFKSLIERLKLLKAFEDADEDSRPTSLTWEVRKSSPGKVLAGPERAKDFAPSPTVARTLNFNLPPQIQRQPLKDSWANRVKGIVPKTLISAVPIKPTQNNTNSTQNNNKPTIQEENEDQNVPKNNTEIDVEDLDDWMEDDSEGWETVHRNGRTKRPLSAGTKNSNTKQQQNNKKNISNPYQRSISLDPHTYKDKINELSSKDDNLRVMRKRANSHDSEKENHPIEEQLIKHYATPKDPAKIENSVRFSQEEDPSILIKGPPVVGGHSTTILSYDTKQSPNAKPGFDSSSPVSNSNKLQGTTAGNSKSGSGSRPQIAEHAEDLNGNVLQGLDQIEQETKAGLVSLKDACCMPAMKPNDMIDDEDDEEQAKLDSALASALDAEDDLSSELEKEQEAALESAIQEEESYLKEIAREESLDVEVETETDSDIGNTVSSTALQQSFDWEAMVQQYDGKPLWFFPIAEADYRQETSWGDMAEDSDTRTPGRVVHMHEKLSSPSRKRSPTESKKRYEEKQAKAQELRLKLQQERSERLRLLTNKVEEVRAWKDELLQQRRETMEWKLQRAEEKRSLQLQLKVRKAHEEENKANEIAFINTLEAQNKRHDIFTKYQESEARLQDIQEERQRKHMEKLAKEAAVEERRRALQAERQARLLEMQEKRKHREEVIEKKFEEKEKERLEAARAKEQSREERIAALNAQQQAHIVELQKKIQIKQEESDRRHKEQLEHIMEKAFSMTILRHSTEDHSEAPKLMPYEIKKFCNVCSVMIPSEVHLSSHLRGKKHQLSLTESNGGKALSKEEIEQFNLRHISDAPSDKPDPRIVSDKERQKALKKRCKKLRQRMSLRGTEYENTISGKQQGSDSEHKAKLQKLIKDLTKYLQGQDKGPWPQNKVSALDRGLGEVSRIMEKKVPVSVDQCTFRILGGLTTLSRILLVIGDSTADMPPVIPSRSLIHCSTVFRLACKSCYDNCHYMLFSNKAGSLVDLLNHQLNLLIPDNMTVDLSSSGGATSLRLPHDPLATSLMQLIATALSVLAKNNPTVNSSEASAERMSTSGDAFMSRANDIVSYIISVGILDKLSQYFNNVRGSIDTQPQAAEFLQHCMGLLIAMIRIISKRNVNIFDSHKKDDSTQLISTFQVTGLVGIVSLMYGMLLHSGAPSRGESAPPELPAHSMMVATVGFRMLNHLATLDLQLLQGSLGEEGTSLEFRHIASYLLWYCTQWSHEELLHEVILCVGYFTVLHPDNQAIIQSGQSPTVLQQLCGLPFQYFSNPKLTGVLFPTLIACCYRNKRNREILEQELSGSLLANFVEEKTLEAQTKQSPTMTKKTKAIDKELDLRVAFGCRFPTGEWSNTQSYFKSDQ